MLYLGLLGAYYAATDGVLMALASAVVPDELRASGLALLVTATSIARLLPRRVRRAVDAVGDGGGHRVFAVGLMARWPLAALGAHGRGGDVVAGECYSLGLGAACAVLAGGSFAWAAARGEAVAAAGVAVRRRRRTRRRPAQPARPCGRSARVLFLDWDRDHPKPGARSRRGPFATRPPRSDPLRCDRVYFAAGRGLCLARAGRSKLSFVARVFAADGTTWRSPAIAGHSEPDARLTDGRFGAVTSFVERPLLCRPGTFATAP